MKPTQRYTIFVIGKRGSAKADSRTSDTGSLYMIVQELKESKRSGYVFDHTLEKVSEFFGGGK